jgi:hypothetical protein
VRTTRRLGRPRRRGRHSRTHSRRSVHGRIAQYYIY